MSHTSYPSGFNLLQTQWALLLGSPAFVPAAPRVVTLSPLGSRAVGDLHCGCFRNIFYSAHREEELAFSMMLSFSFLFFSSFCPPEIRV